MKRGDGTTFWICNGCGRVPIYNEAEQLFVCPTCDGPLQFSGVTADTLTLQMPTKQSRVTFSRVAMPYALKLLDQELTSFSNTGFRFVTEGSVARLRDGAWPWPEETFAVKEGEGAAEGVEAVNPEALAELEAAVREAAQSRRKKPAAVGGVATGPVPGASAALSVIADATGSGSGGGDATLLPPGQGPVEFSARNQNEYTGFSNFATAPFRMPGAQIRAPDGTAYPEFGVNPNGAPDLAKQTWPTLEHYYQAMKFPADPDWQDAIRQAPSPLRAKKMGLSPEHPVRGDWDAIKERVMKSALLAKFRQNPALLVKLQETGERPLVETSPGDSYWGAGTRGKGLNRMGALLSEVRTELKDVRVDLAVTSSVPSVGQVVEGPEENAAILSEPEDVAAEAQQIVEEATGVNLQVPQGVSSAMGGMPVMSGGGGGGGGGGGVGGSNVFMIINPNIGGDHKARRARGRGGGAPISWAGMETSVTKEGGEDGESSGPFNIPDGGNDGNGTSSADVEGAQITVEKLG